MKVKDKRRLIQIATERGGGQLAMTIDNRPIGKRIRAINRDKTDKQLNDTEAARVCDHLPVGRCIIIRGNVTVWHAPEKRGQNDINM